MIRYLALTFLVLCGCKTPPVKKQISTTKDHFFIFGGGYSATGNQISLEKNINYINSVLSLHPPKSKYILFADGNKKERSLQYRLNDGFPDKFQELLIYCLGTTKRINDHYRPHTVVNQGPLKKLEIEKYFREKGSEIKKDERLFVYYTGHGGKGDKNDPQNTGLYLWHDGIYRMKDFSTRLQTVPKEVPIVCIMVQCFAGGFQNLIFKEGDANKGLVDNNICGFYATVHDRIASGCTPEINEENYQEYSTWFWAALSGKNRLGFKILKPDYNGDRKTSFDEAHAYTIINLRSIDIPVKTSELVLRQYTPKTFSKSLGVSQKSTIKDYIKHSDSTSRAVIEALMKQTGASQEWKIGDVFKEAEEIARKMKSLKKANEDRQKKLKNEKVNIAGKIRYHYPEFGNLLHPETHNLLVLEKENMKRILEADKEFVQFRNLYNMHSATKNQIDTYERQWVVFRRLARVLENVLYEPYFLQAAPPHIKEKYLQIRKLEMSFF
ncbi:MAG: hypothetical protein NE328_14610 [Lentisphaeraceae bacterium]|nr:hypothetical protein [Lentisphaeraceae bacterium]